jgi:transcriptional regulator with XRE-family HTH domain
MARAINGTAVREIRELVGIDQYELARRCEIDQGTVSNIERRKHGASPKVARKIADALGVSIDAITTPVPEPETATA